MVHVAVADAGRAERLRTGDAECLGTRQVLHLADHRRLHALAAADHIDGLVGEVLGAFGGDEDQRAAAVRDQAALEQVERIGDQPRVEHVLHGDRIPVRRARIHPRPLALRHRHHRQLFVGHAVLLHVAQHADGEHRGGAHRAVGHLELRRQRSASAAATATANAGSPALAVGHQNGVRVASLDGRHGVAHMQHERAAADGTAVHPARRDTEVVGDGHRRLAGRRHAVDVLGGKAGVGKRVERRIGVQLDLAQVGDLAQFGGFGGADDCYCHKRTP